MQYEYSYQVPFEGIKFKDYPLYLEEYLFFKDTSLQPLSLRRDTLSFKTSSTSRETSQDLYLDVFVATTSTVVFGNER